jgi:hypothetical protein
MRFLLAMAFLSIITGNSGLVHADDLWLATGSEFPGKLRLSEGGTVPRVVISRHDTPNRAYPNAIMKVAQVAQGFDQAIYYCSGLDGSVMHLIDARHEIQLFEVAHQVRDLACTSEEHTVYYSVVPTPQNGQALADGQIYRRDLWDGSPQLVATIPQHAVGGNWWGCFTLRDSDIYLATLDAPSRLFKWSAGTVTPVFTGNTHEIRGLTVAGDGSFLLVNGTGQVWRTGDFQHFEAVLNTPLQLTDVNSRALATSLRP